MHRVPAIQHGRTICPLSLMLQAKKQVKKCVAHHGAAYVGFSHASGTAVDPMKGGAQ
jgi:hypothetical protein